MPSQLDQLVNSLQAAPTTQVGASSVNTYNQPTSQLDQLIKSLNPVTNPTVNTNPLNGPVAPTGIYNTQDLSKINIDGEVLNSDLRNMWNSFKRGIDEIQISTAQGKFEYSPFGDASAEIIDNYPDQKRDLDDQLQRGLIDETRYAQELQSLNSSYQNALDARAQTQQSIAANQVEINNEPVSKEYQYKNWLTQQAGDKASFWDKTIYSMPQVMGSSASLMVPQLAATFGSNIAKALLRSSITYLAGPEAGLPANAIATVGAVALSVGEVLWGRAQESYGEVGSTIMENRQKLMEQYAREHGLSSIDEIPEDVQREIRIQSRKGSDMQFKENMALAASDVAQAILMPGSQLAGTLEGTFGSIGKAIKEAGDYSTLTRTLRTAGKVYYNALGEKFEEGFQQAAQYRATDEALGLNKYQNKGLMANILTDSFDTASSLNYSLIPGITLRPNGKYSQDKEFQFAEDSGGMLGLFMSAIPTAISIGKDIATYRTATKRLAKDGIINPEDKIFGLQNSIMMQYFNKGQVQYLVEAMRSLRNKKAGDGQDVLSDADFADQIKNIKEAYNVYEGASERINNLRGDKWAFFNTKELSQAKAMIKELMMRNALGTVKTTRELEGRISDRDRLASQEHVLSGDSAETNNYKSLINELENATRLKESIDQYLTQNLDTVPNVGERARPSLEARAKFLDEYIKDTQERIEEERGNLDTLGIDYGNIKEVGTDLDQANSRAIVSEMNLNEYQENYNELLKIKDYKAAKAYYQKQMQTKQFADNSPLNTDEGAEAAEPTNRTSDSTESFGDTEAYEEGYEEEIPEEPEQAPEGNPLADFTGTTSEATPEGEGYVNDTVRNAFRDALDDLEAAYDDMPPAKSVAERIAALEQGLANAGIDLAKVKFPDLYRIFRDNFIDNPDYIKNKFELLRAVSQAYKAERGATQAELKEIRTVELDPESLELLGEQREYNTPPEQTAEQTATANDEVVKSAKREESDLEQGSGLKITSGLSLATKNVISGRTAQGEIGDFRENGQMQFVEDTDQQLINTNFVSVGDEINVRITSLPEGFNVGDSSDQNYDLVNIEVYKTVKETGPNGTIEKELLIGSLHRVQKLPELLAESADLQYEQELLRQQRKNIIQSASRNFKAEVVDKGFGFLNKNARSLQIPIFNVFGNDQRAHLSTVAASGQAIETRDGIVYARGISPMIPGANIIFIPNETKNGTIYLPVYLTKQQLRKNEDILNKVTASITEFLKTGSRKFMTDAEQYVYITREPNEKLGLKGVFWNYTKEGNVPYVNINGKRYNMKNINDLKSALGNIYFTLNRNALNKVEGYESEIIKSGLLTTNITTNNVLSNRYNSKEYSFLKDNQQNQYFSQHTIKLENFREVKSELPQDNQTEPQSLDTKAEISRLRAERVEKAKEMGFAFEDGKGSMKGLYDTVLSWLADPETLADPENSEDIIQANAFLAMYDEYEAQIDELKENNNTSAPEETIPAPQAEAQEQVWYQGYNTLDQRDINYFASNEAEARDYGSNVRTVTVNAQNTLDYYSNMNVLTQYKKETKKGFDLLDNSSEGLQEQADFFEYVKGLGYDSIKFNDQYLVTLTNSIVSNQTTTEGNAIEGVQFTEEENPEVREQLENLGLDIDFDDLVGSIEVEYDNSYKSNLGSVIGLKTELGARYSNEEVEAIEKALNKFNRENNTSHELVSIKIGNQNAIALSLQNQWNVDDIGTTSLESKLLVSKDISATLQNQMVDSIAYMLLTNEKPKSTQLEAEAQDITNKDKVLKTLNDKLTALRTLLTKPNTPEALSKIQTLVNNYELMTKHYEGLYDKAIEVLNGLGFEQTDENSDYFENLEEQIEDNNVTQFNDDSNSTRNQKNFLPAEVKKLIYFIPNLQLRDLSDPKQVADMQNEKSEYFGKPYKAKPNALGLSSFNDFNDTWEKTLSIISQRTYSSDDSGFVQMLKTLQKEQNPIIVKELASRLQKAGDQVKNAFFRRTYLQKQQNKTTIVNYRNNKSWKDQDGNWHQGTTTKTTQIINADQRQGVRFVANQFEQEFRVNGLVTGILTNELEESTGRMISKVNTTFGKELLESVKTLLADNTNYVTERAAVGNVKAKQSSKFTDQAKAKLLELIHQTGMELSYGGLSDLLKYYRVANSQYTGDERAVAVEIFQNTIFKRLAGLQGTNTIDNQVAAEEEVKTETDYELNNPFKKDASTIQSIARYEFGYRVQNQSGSYRSNGKSYYPFTRHSYLSEMFTDMTAWLRDRTRGESGEKNVFAKLRTDHFAQQSLYLNAIANPVANPEFAKTFKLRYELGTRNRASLDGTDKLLQEMTEREHQIAKITDFQNSGNRAAAFHYDTLSDKITKPIVDALRQDVMYATETQTIEGGNIVLSNAIMDTLYRYFKAEYARINDVKIQNATLEKHEMIKGYHGEKGMGQFFNIYYFLNKDVLDVDNPDLSKAMYDAQGNLVEVNDELESQIKSEINKHYNKIFAKTKLDFRSLGLFDLENKNARKEFDPLIQDMVDANYLKKNAIKLGLENFKGLGRGQYYKLNQNQLNRIVDFAIVDYVVNYSIFSNEMLMFTGDPAQAGKMADKGTISKIKERFPDDVAQQKKFTTIANVESTYVNVGKRNAAFLGSGEKGKFKNSLYSVAIANDIAIGSPQFEQYKSFFKGNEAAVEKAYNNGDLTDAQEVTTVEEHLHTMLAFGQITGEQYEKFLYIYDRQHFNELFPGKSLSVSEKDRFEAFGIVMQPMKPVQRTYNIDDKLHASKQYYIKTSSYPLVPDMIKGTPLEALLQDMKKQKVERIAFVSATKQGVAGAKDLFGKDGNYNESFLENNQNVLERDGFRIQLEVPYKDSKDAIREGTQLAKLIFVDIPEDLSVNYQDGKSTVGELKQKYNEYHKKIIDYKTQELLNEIGAEKDENGRPVVYNLQKLAKIIQEEGIGRGYSINALLGLDLDAQGRFKVPLTFLPNTGQIQPVLTAIVSNRIARLKMPGKSYVQGSEFVLNRGKVESDLSKIDQRNIVWTKPEYSGISKLQYLREEDGKVKPAQIVMPFYFIDPETKKRVDLRKYITKDKEGRTLLDTSKIDPELLEINGFRIPFQGHNSGMWFEIVGFLPYEMGDLVIVPGEIAAQMGSDYDVDKLYAYMYNYKLSLADTARISKVNSKDPSTVEAYQNALIDIHKAIFTSQDLFQPILDPLSFADVEEAIDELGSEESKEFLGAFDPTYQRDVYFSNRGGQLGVGITANANTSHALSQSINLFIKGQGVLFLDENSKPYVDRPDESDRNRVNKFTDQSYTYRAEGETINQNDGSQKSAWRLDKIYTFTKNPKTGQPYKISNLISQLLGVSVDNAKEQKLGAYGLNKFNFNVAVSIVRAGFDLITTKAFINQPILKEYYEAIGATEDMFSVDFTPNKREQAVKDIFKKYTDRFGIKENIYEADQVEGFTLEDMKKSLAQGNVNESNALQQLQVLKAFLHYKNISDGLQGIVSALNIDTKGLPKNVSETINKQEAIANNVYDNALFGNTQRFVSDTIPGLFSTLPNTFEDIFANPKNPLFAYSSAAYVSAQNKVEFLTGRKIIGQDKIDRFHNSIKQFLYTSDKIRTIEEGKTVDQVRQELLFDFESTKSLQTRYLELKVNHPQNDLLKAINPIISEYSNAPKLLEIVLSSEDDYTERIRQYWEFMLNNSEQSDLQSFAQDLLKYAMLVSSQEYGTSNMIKYIPFSALENIGFGEELNRINNNMFQNEELLDSFVNQFIQHEMDYVLSAKEKNFTKGSVQYQTITVIENDKSEVKNTNIINKFSLPKYDPAKVADNPAASLLREDSEGTWDYPGVLSVFIDSNIGKLLYQKKQNSDGTVDYYRIDTLGANNVSEYDFSGKAEFKKSLIEANRSNAVIPTANASTSIFETKVKVSQADDIPLAEKYFPTGVVQSVSTLIDTVIGNTSKMSGSDAQLFSELAQAIGRYNLTTPIRINENHNTRGTTYSVDGIVTEIVFNPKLLFRGTRTTLNEELDGVRSILHELIHALTTEQIRNQAYRESPQYKQLNSVWEEYKDVVRNASKAKERGVNVNVYDAEMFKELVSRYKFFRGTNEHQSNIYVADLNQTIKNLSENEQEIRDVISSVGKNLQQLSTEGKIPAANYDLVSNTERYNKFKDRLLGTFKDELKDNINKYYGYYNLAEFVTEAMTNPNTQAELKKIPSIWQRFRSAIASLVARILGYDKNERSLLDDAIDATIDLADMKFKQQEVQSMNDLKIDSYQYYGAKYDIEVDQNGRGVNIPDYKGPKAKMQVILDAYNQNPDVDPQNGKYFRQPKNPKPSVQFHISREYRIPSGKVISFNDQQYTGLQEIDKWLKNPNQLFFTLSGYAGTGKTTIVKAILDSYRGSVAVTAPTHKAKNVISRTTGKGGETIQKLLGLRPNTDLENFNPNRPQFDPLATAKIGTYRWVIIDEASMLNKGLFNLLVKKAKESNTKILFMGDPAQIPPVGENISDVFDSSIIDAKHQLDKVERQAGSNPLMSVYDKIRSNITSTTDQFDHKTKLNNEGEGIEFTKSIEKFKSEAIRTFLSNEYESDRNYAKLITYTNKSVGEWNNVIRTALFGQDSRQYEEGDTIMSYRTFDTPAVSVENSSDFIVKSVMPLENHGTYGLDGFKLKIKDVDELGGTKEIFIVKRDQKNLSKYKDIHDDLLRKALATKSWGAYYAFRNSNLLDVDIQGDQKIVKDFDYGYAVTAHKSQGSTYTNVFVDEGNIDGVSDTTDRNKIKYVAFSRPTNKVLSLSGKTVDEGINHYIQQDDMLLSLPRDVNEITDKELEDFLKFCKG